MYFRHRFLENSRIGDEKIAIWHIYAVLHKIRIERPNCDFLENSEETSVYRRGFRSSNLELSGGATKKSMKTIGLINGWRPGIAKSRFRKTHIIPVLF